MIKEFKINVLEEQISSINNKIKNYPWSYIEDMYEYMELIKNI